MTNKKHKKEVRTLERLVAPENLAKMEAVGWKLSKDATKHHKSLKHMTLEVEVEPQPEVEEPKVVDAKEELKKGEEVVLEPQVEESK